MGFQAGRIHILFDFCFPGDSRRWPIVINKSAYRLTFWLDNISPNISNNVLQITLHKFKDQERDAYLAKRFYDEPDDQPFNKKDRARTILKRIASRTAAYKTTRSHHSVDLDEPYGAAP
jgi:uncharacterized protein YeaO (DUF488 family)